MSAIRPAIRAAIRPAIRSVFGGGGPVAISPPVGYGSVPFGVTVYEDGTTDFVAESPIVEGGAGVSTYYVDKATGLDTNAGTSVAPFKTIYKAITISRATAPKMLLKVKGGTYYLEQNFNEKIPEATTLSCVSWDGEPVICSNEVPGLTWTLDSDNTYWASLAVANSGYAEYRSSAWDGLTTDDYGDDLPLIPAASLAACKAAAGTYYTDQAAVRIYVHTSDNRAPDADIHVYESWGNPGQYRDYGAAPATGECYFENIHFRGGSASFTFMQSHATNTHRGVFKDCTFKYGGIGTSTSVNITGNVDVALVSCVVSTSHADGFSYHSYGAKPAPRGLEINCEARRCGVILSGTANQGSTAHDGASILRVGGNYHHNENDQVADVGASKAWMVNCTASSGLKANYAGFLAGNGVGNTTTWLDGCTVSGCTYDLTAGTGSTIYTRNFAGAATNSGAGTITTY